MERISTNMRTKPFGSFVEKYNKPLQTNPENFSNWLDRELSKTYPVGLQWSDDIKNLILVGELIPPNNETSQLYYFYYVDGWIHDKEHKLIKKIQQIIQIELQVLREETIQVKCRCFDHPPLIEYLERLFSEIERIFTPKIILEEYMSVPPLGEKPKKTKKT